MANVLRTFWSSLLIAGSLLGIVASVISIYAFARLLRVEELVRKGEDWRLEINVSGPAHGAQLESQVAELEGTIKFYATAADVEAPARVNLALAEEEVDIVPLVSPLSEANRWWAQPIPMIDRNGDFRGRIFLGAPTGEGIGMSFQIVVLAVPRGSLPEGSTLTDMPFHFQASNVVTVKRLR